MKRAEVYRSWVLNLWQVALWEGQPADRRHPIARRDPDVGGGKWISCTDHPTHAAALAHAIREVGLAPCECVLLPEKYHTTHYGATEPGSMYEFNPDCPAHGYDVHEVGLTPTHPEPMEAP